MAVQPNLSQSSKAGITTNQKPLGNKPQNLVSKNWFIYYF